jgi:hypothetical protein
MLAECEPHSSWPVSSLSVLLLALGCGGRRASSRAAAVDRNARLEMNLPFLTADSEADHRSPLRFTTFD